MENSIEIFMPGRLCIFGEHSDWASSYQKLNNQIEDGSVIVTGIEQGIFARASKEENKIILITKIDDKNIYEKRINLNIDLLAKQLKYNDFFSYALGTILYIVKKYNVKGIKLNCYKVTLPIKKGLASSAAICMLVTRAFNKLYNLNLSIEEEMEIAYQGEHLAHSQCGKMDQICGFGQKVVNIRFSNSNTEIKEIKVKKDIFMLFADLRGNKKTRKILSDLNSSYPYAKDYIDEGVQTALGKINLNIVNKAIYYINNGEIEKLGQLMTESQVIFDKYVAIKSNELRGEKLHEILGDSNVKKLALGGKGVGSQGDGSIQFIVRDKVKQKELKEYLENKYSLEVFYLTINGEEI